MRKVLPAVMSGLVTVAFSPIAAAQPEQAGATVIHQRGAQNSSQIGAENQSTQVYGNENQTTTQAGAGNTAGDSAQSAEQDPSAAGSGNVSSRGNRDNKGLHKGWEKNRHRDEQSGRYGR